ncbi:MAG: LacI family DNA-binding transcriptional regulator [Verrucomicrobia bacterium]|nr:LacI family DNA-binding transcriptional regulator [Verrucomicrobiota bacterium]MDA1065355.1 LacI family DNA-binding transcriptional regulator [Verrucomicrobiota bacterium]
MITSTKDLAEYLGLSRWTISRVLNGHPEVKEETRQRVLEAANSFGFSPNAMARGLRGGSTGLIGVCFQELESPALAKKMSFLQRQLRSLGFQGMIELTDGDPELEESVIRHFLSLKTDGIILVGSTLKASSRTINRLVQTGVSIVLVDPIHQLPFPTIHLDRAGIMERIVEHLWNRGHRQFALLGIESDRVLGKVRIDGIRKGLEKFKGDFASQVSSYTAPGFGLQDYGYGYSLAKTVLDIKDPATAWIAMNDRLAIGALSHLRERKIEVPEKLALVGFDNLDISSWYDPPLTTVDQVIPKLFREVVARLVSSINEPLKNATSIDWIFPELIIRKTS